MSIKKGYILLCREILDHWLWRDPVKLKFWLLLIMLANFQDNDMVIGNNIITVKRGSFITSLHSLSQRMNISVNTIRTWLKLFQKAVMIEMITTTKFTQITILNYALYQDIQQTKRKQSAKQTDTPNENQTNTDCSQINKDNQKSSNYNECNIKSLFLRFKEIYFYFHANILNNLKPKFGGREGKSLNALIKYFIEAANGNETEAIDLFNTMFHKWGELKPFYQSWVDINSIANNITTILNDLNNGKSNAGKSEQRATNVNKW